MKAEELMIGDWFQTTYPSGRLVYQKVIGIFDGCVYTEGGIINAIEPIPITPEILEKNGFKQEDNDCYLWNENLERIIWFEDSYTVITSVRCDRVYEGHCYNVHELQHALRLCNITKNIEL